MRDHRKNHLRQRFEQASKALQERRDLDLKRELSAAFQRVNGLLEACEKFLQNKSGQYSLTQRNGFRAAELLLKAVNMLDKHLRMLGDLTGEFKQPAENPNDVERQRFEGAIRYMLDKCDGISRAEAVEVLAYQIPEIAEYEASLDGASSIKSILPMSFR